MNFEDLVFDKGKPGNEMRRAKADFPNGYTASVIIGEYSYGGPEGLYELGLMHGGHLCYLTPVTDDVVGHLTPKQVTELLAQIEALPRNNECLHAEGQTLEIRKKGLAAVLKKMRATTGGTP